MKADGKGSTWTTTDVRRVDSRNRTQRALVLLNIGVDVKRGDLPDHGRCLRTGFGQKTQKERQ